MLSIVLDTSKGPEMLAITKMKNNLSHLLICLQLVCVSGETVYCVRTLALELGKPRLE